MTIMGSIKILYSNWNPAFYFCAYRKRHSKKVRIAWAICLLPFSIFAVYWITGATVGFQIDGANLFFSHWQRRENSSHPCYLLQHPKTSMVQLYPLHHSNVAPELNHQFGILTTRVVESNAQLCKYPNV